MANGWQLSTRVALEAPKEVAGVKETTHHHFGFGLMWKAVHPNQKAKLGACLCVPRIRKS